MNKKSIPPNDLSKKSGSSKTKKEQTKPAGDASYNALQQKINRTTPDRHQGESQMNDENRSGGSRQ